MGRFVIMTPTVSSQQTEESSHPPLNVTAIRQEIVPN